MEQKRDAITYALGKLRQAQAKLLQLGRDENQQDGLKENLVTELWVLASEIGSASAMIGEQAEDEREEVERAAKWKFYRGVNQELGELLPRIHKAPYTAPSQMGLNPVVEIENPHLGYVDLYDPPSVRVDLSPPYKPASEPGTDQQAGEE